MATVASIGGLTFVTPFRAATAYEFFALSTGDSGHTQVFDRWRYLGQDGVNLKAMGLGGRTGTIVGWLDADGIANLNTAQSALRELVRVPFPGDIFIAGGTSIYGTPTGVAFPRLWGHDGRLCQDFVLTWEELL